MAASAEQREHAVERAGKIFAIIRTAAESGQQCPTNKTLADRFGCGTPQIVNALHFLEANGMIEVERMNDTRIVTICASGKQTSGQPGKAHWSANTARRVA